MRETRFGVNPRVDMVQQGSGNLAEAALDDPRLHRHWRASIVVKIRQGRQFI
jgi:hypothetical protein